MTCAFYDDLTTHNTYLGIIYLWYTVLPSILFQIRLCKTCRAQVVQVDLDHFGTTKFDKIYFPKMIKSQLLYYLLTVSARHQHIDLYACQQYEQYHRLHKCHLLKYMDYIYFNTTEKVHWMCTVLLKSHDVVTYLN